MTQVDEIEELQIELNENPKSLNFVRLAEIYLQRDMADDAENLVRRSLKFHPKSVSGLILLGRILKNIQNHDEAIINFQRATQLAPENWKAWLEMAETYMAMQRAKDALASFKRVLFLNPNHPLARRAVAKLEILTADEYDDDLFSMEPLQKAQDRPAPPQDKSSGWSKIPSALERSLALVDALTVRLDTKKALNLLNECSKKYGNHPEIEARRLRLSTYDKPEYIAPKHFQQSSLAKQELIKERKIKTLEELLRRIETLQTDRLSTMS